MFSRLAACCIGVGLAFGAVSQSSPRDTLARPASRHVSPARNNYHLHKPGTTYIYTVSDLQNIQNNLAGNYVLANDVDASGVNFAAIGTYGNPFTGTLNGNGFTISNLTITGVQACISNSDCAGLFGYSSGEISNLRLLGLNFNLTCSRSCYIGAIAAADAGILNAAFVEGSIIAKSSQRDATLTVGGAVGAGGSLSFVQSNVSINVSGSFCDNYIGGLAGESGNIQYASALGPISVSNTTGCAVENPVGGLVGENDGTISDSYAMGSVTDNMSGDSVEPYDGGFVGVSLGTILRSFATGSVTSTASNSIVGGFAGINWFTLKEAFSTGSVQSNGLETGGFIGQCSSGCALSQTYATGYITAPNGVTGGFAGNSNSGYSSSYWDLNTSGISDPSKGCGNIPNCSGVVGLKTKNFKGKIPGGLNTPDWVQINFPFHSDYPKFWAPSFPVTAFPFNGYTPFTIPIVTVFDHSLQDSPNSGTGRLYACDQVVRAFEGSTGEKQYGADASGCKQPGYKQQSKMNFVLNGVNYVGLPAKYLEYDGHPGFDYAASLETPVYAAVSGTAFYPWRAVGSGNRNDTYCRFHTLAQIPDAAPTYRIYYLHLYTHPARVGQANPDCNSSNDTDGQTVAFTAQANCYTDMNGNPINPTTLPLPEGTHVNAGCEIALSGDAGVPGSPHLHFEIQQMVPAAALTAYAIRLSYFPCYNENRNYKQGVAGSDPYCLPADPYGYTATDTQCNGDPLTWTGDIWQCLTGISGRRFWAQ